MMKTCPNGHTVDDDVKFCTVCGAEVEEKRTKTCSRCGKESDSESKFCEYCGAPLDVPVSTTKADCGTKADSRKETHNKWSLPKMLILDTVAAVILISGVIAFRVIKKKNVNEAETKEYIINRMEEIYYSDIWGQENIIDAFFSSEIRDLQHKITAYRR